jgi:short-subunit dehydrogenase
MNQPKPNQTALITGATSGIGLELAKIFAREGYPLVLVARGREKLLQLKEEFERSHDVPVKIIEKDLSKDTAPMEIYEELKREAIRVRILVNNAGSGVLGKFAATDLKAELDMIQLNVTSLTHLTKLFLRDMVADRSGKILNVASTAAFQPGPLMAVYYASKAYVLSFTEALANELEGSGVTATALCPGPTFTDFQKRSGMENTRLFRSGLTMDAATVAKAGFRGLMMGKTVVVPGWKNRIMVASLRLAPRGLVTKVVRDIQETRK